MLRPRRRFALALVGAVIAMPEIGEAAAPAKSRATIVIASDQPAAQHSGRGAYVMQTAWASDRGYRTSSNHPQRGRSSSAAAGSSTQLPGGRRYYGGRYFGNFNNRFYGPQYGYF